jgi:hypothetical protein
MRLLGQVEVAAFVRHHPDETEVLAAWLNEVRHHGWANSDALMADFRSAEAHQPPYAVFRLGPTPVFVETIVDYRNGVILVERLRVRDPVTRTAK